MASSSGSAAQKRIRDKSRAADLKRNGVERTQQKCPNCYRIIPCEGPKSRYTHVCR